MFWKLSFWLQHFPIIRERLERLVGAKNKNLRKQKFQQIDDGTPEDSSSIKQTINIMLKSSFNITPPEKASPKEIKVLKKIRSP